MRRKLDARDRLVVVGKTGTGKSNWVKQFCASLMASGQRVVVFDICDEYSEHGHKSPYVHLGPLTHRVKADELHLNPSEHLDRPDLALAIVPEGDPDEVADQFELIAEQVRFTGNLVFIVEEVGYFGEHCQERLKSVATMYRHHGVTVVFVSQRAIQVPLTARSQASRIIAFSQDEQADLDALDARCSRNSPDFAERVARLDIGECAEWRADLKPPLPTKEASP